MNKLYQKLIGMHIRRETQINSLLSIPTLDVDMDNAFKGVSAEKKVYSVLKKYCDEIISNVTIRSEKKDFLTEIDFICRINNILLVIEVKEWYGKLEFKSNNKNVVLVSYVNLSGKFRCRSRTNPLFALSAAYCDLKEGKKADFFHKFKKNQVRKIIVFTRDEIDLEDFTVSENYDVLKMKELEAYLKKLKETTFDFDSFLLPDDFPSWDVAYHREHGWIKIALLNSYITVNDQKIDISDIKSLVFNDTFDEEVLVEKRNEELIYGNIDLETIRLSSRTKFKDTNIEYIYFDPNLHSEIV